MAKPSENASGPIKFVPSVPIRRALVRATVDATSRLGRPVSRNDLIVAVLDKTVDELVDSYFSWLAAQGSAAT